MNLMSHKYQVLLKLSRPRFWFYLAGPFLIGYAAGVGSLADFNWKFYMMLNYFIFVANVMLYGINDLADEAIDKVNFKKEEKEIRVDNTNRELVRMAVAASLALSLMVFMILSKQNYILMMIFLFLSAFYSLPPIRFKSIPVLDFLSNALYVIPGFIAYNEVTNELPVSQLILASILWAGAMHLFSAIVDIEPDKKSGIITTAVWIGYDKSIILCSCLWLGSWTLLFFEGVLGNYIYLFLIYPIIPFMLLLNKKIKIEYVYWFFPYINTILGFILFLISFERLI